MGGYWDTGRLNIATNPSTMVRIAMTLASTGRSMKNFASIVVGLRRPLPPVAA